MKESLAILWRRTVNVLAIIGALTVLAIIISIIVAINRPRVRLAGQSAVRAVALAPVSISTPIPTNTNVPPTETLTPVPPTDTPTTTPVPPTVTPEWMAPPFDEICGLNSNLTEIQQNAKVKAMLGKKLVGWIGKVYDVKRDGDKYTISVDMTSGLFRTRNLVITGITDASVAGLNVDQQISFDATIQDIDIVFGVVCNPMTVTDAKITPQ